MSQASVDVEVSSFVGTIARMVERSADSVSIATNDPAHGWVVRAMDSEGPTILRLLWRLLGNEADVLDAYQDCFCRLASRTVEKDIERVKAYVYRTASNIAVEMIRVRKRQRNHLAAFAEQRNGSSDHAETSDASDGFDGLPAAVAHLPPHLQSVVVLRDLCRFSYEDIGRILRIDPATARVYRRHAVVKLAERLGEGETSHD